MFSWIFSEHNWTAAFQLRITSVFLLFFILLSLIIDGTT